MSMSEKVFRKCFPEAAALQDKQDKLDREKVSPDKPMLQIKFAERFIKDIKSGKKTQTIRKYDYAGVQPDDIIQVDNYDIKLRVISVKKTTLGKVTGKTVIKENLTFAEFKEFWVSVYGEYDKDVVVHIIRFKILKKKKSKYNNQKTEINGIKFDSRREANYSIELGLLAKVGIIDTIVYQPKYVLQEGFRKNGKAIRAIFYIADFEVVYSDGRTEVIDVKGVKTKIYQLKKKLFEYKYPNLILKEV